MGKFKLLNEKELKNIDMLQKFFIQNEYQDKNEHERFKLLIEFIIKNKIKLNDNIYFYMKFKTQFIKESEDLKQLLDMFIFDDNFIS